MCVTEIPGRRTVYEGASRGRAGHEQASESTPAPGIGNRSRVRRYRARHRRSDYAPAAEALAIIEAWLDRKLDNCAAGVINRLVRAEHRAMSGNGGRR